jgi:hypothetical protein
MSLDASIDLPMGTEELLEPALLSEFGSRVDRTMLQELAAESMSTIPEGNLFCKAVTIFTFNKSTVERFF